MGEFDDLDPRKVAESVEDQRIQRLKQQAEDERWKAEEARVQAEAASTSLQQAVQRTLELFEFLKKAFDGREMSDKHRLVVERRGSRPEGTGMFRYDEQPGWIVIRGSGASTGPRHRPIGTLGTPEYVLAARCGTSSRYELLIYPTLRQDRTDSFATDDRDEFMKRIQAEIAGR